MCVREHAYVCPANQLSMRAITLRWPIDALLPRCSHFPPDLFFVLRTVQLLRGLANGMGVHEFSAASQWCGPFLFSTVKGMRMNLVALHDDSPPLWKGLMTVHPMLVSTSEQCMNARRPSRWSSDGSCIIEITFLNACFGGGPRGMCPLQH